MEKQNISWLVPSTLVETFHILTNPLSSKKINIEVPGKIPLFQLKPCKLPFLPSPSKVSHPFSSPNQSIFKMVGQQPLDMMDRMVATRYAPLVLSHPINSLPGGDYQKYLPRFNGQDETTAEEHWNAFLSYADNQNIEAKDVWMRMFVQSLDVEVRRWF